MGFLDCRFESGWVKGSRDCCSSLAQSDSSLQLCSGLNVPGSLEWFAAILPIERPIIATVQPSTKASKSAFSRSLCVIGNPCAAFS